MAVTANAPWQAQEQRHARQNGNAYGHGKSRICMEHSANSCDANVLSSWRDMMVWRGSEEPVLSTVPPKHASG
jgi:hypothetical protein